MSTTPLFPLGKLLYVEKLKEESLKIKLSDIQNRIDSEEKVLDKIKKELETQEKMAVELMRSSSNPAFLVHLSPYLDGYRTIINNHQGSIMTLKKNENEVMESLQKVSQKRMLLEKMESRWLQEKEKDRQNNDEKYTEEMAQILRNMVPTGALYEAAI